MALRRTRSEAAALAGEVLDRWAKGSPAAAIAAVLRVNAGDVSRIVHQARRHGDARAGFRYHVAGMVRVSSPPAPRPAPQPIVVDLPRAVLLRAARAAAEAAIPQRARRAAILDAWAAGLDAQTIGATLGMRWRSVMMVVVRARASGDHRAHRRQHDPAEGLSDNMRVTLDRLDRRYGVTASIPGETPCQAA